MRKPKGLKEGLKTQFSFLLHDLGTGVDPVEKSIINSIKSLQTDLFWDSRLE